MTLADRLAHAASQQDPRGPRCPVDTALRTLSDEDRDILVAALMAPKDKPGYINHTTLAKVVSEETGVRVPMASLGHHRRRNCRCWS